MSIMTATTKNLLDKIASWPPEDQEELAQYVREIEARRTGVYRLSEDEQQGIERGLKAMHEGKFASDERVAAIFKKARSSQK